MITLNIKNKAILFPFFTNYNNIKTFFSFLLFIKIMEKYSLNIIYIQLFWIKYYILIKLLLTIIIMNLLWLNTHF